MSVTRRRLCLMACAGVLMASGPARAVAAAPGSACGQTLALGARHSLGPGPAPLAIGDSILYGAAPVLADYGFATNSMVCRTMAQGIAWLAAHQSSLPVLVVVELGTNGPVTPAQLGQLLTLIGPQRLLALVTPHHGNYGYVPGLFRSFAAAHPGRIALLDWDRLVAGHPEWLAPDGIHLGSAAGIAAYARLIAEALVATPVGGVASAPSAQGATSSSASTSTGTSTATVPPPPPAAPVRPPHSHSVSHRPPVGARVVSALRRLGLASKLDSPLF